MLYRLRDIQSCTLEARDGEIGDVHDVYFDDRFWTVRYLVVDTGKWLPGRKVLIAPEAFGEPDVFSRRVPVDLSREQIKQSPDRSSDLPVGRQQEIELRQHYGWPLYWESYPSLGVGAAVGLPSPAVAAAVPPGEAEDAIDGDPNLRSAREVNHYVVAARDGEVGQVADFILEGQEWIVRYLLVDTGKWLPGKRVPIAPQWSREVDWVSRRVHLDLDRRAVKEAPVYDPEQAMDRDYETRLWGHYGVPGYWF